MPHYLNNSAEKAAEAIIKESIKRWQEEDSSIDDITCIIIFLSIWSILYKFLIKKTFYNKYVYIQIIIR